VQQQGVTAAEVEAALGPPLPPVACNDAELADARWFSRGWLAAVLSGEELIHLDTVSRASYRDLLAEAPCQVAIPGIGALCSQATAG
jgi:hypothetical protein